MTYSVPLETDMQPTPDEREHAPTLTPENHMCAWEALVVDISNAEHAEKGPVKNLPDGMLRLKWLTDRVKLAWDTNPITPYAPTLRTHLQHVASICFRIDQFLNNEIGTPAPAASEESHGPE